MGKGSKPIQPQSEKKPPAQASSHVHVPAPAAAGVLETADDTGLETATDLSQADIDRAFAQESYQDQGAQASLPAPVQPKPEPKRGMKANPREDYKQHRKFAKFKGRT
jgi:hypothetical protein